MRRIDLHAHIRDGARLHQWGGLPLCLLLRGAEDSCCNRYIRPLCGRCTYKSALHHRLGRLDSPR